MKTNGLNRARWAMALAAMLAALAGAPRGAQADPVQDCADPTKLTALVANGRCGTVTHQPIPRYASLRSSQVNLREGPSKDHRATWIFQRAGLPVEITGEFETWRKIRDSEGSEGWVLNSLLSGRRTGLVAPWKKGENIPVFSKPSDSASLAAQLQSGVIGNIKKCDGTWCHIFGDGFDGYIQQQNLWGVYPNELVE
jgi:SH3-like domain-containing protein